MSTTPENTSRSPEWKTRMVALAREHSAAEARGDLEATLATLEPDCVYELHPSGRMFCGIDTARRAYEAFFSSYRAAALGAQLRSEWVTDDGLGQEYKLAIRGPAGERQLHTVIGIITFGDNLLSGERVYASERFHRLAYGSAYDESVPLPPDYFPGPEVTGEDRR